LAWHHIGQKFLLSWGIYFLPGLGYSAEVKTIPHPRYCDRGGGHTVAPGSKGASDLGYQSLSSGLTIMVFLLALFTPWPSASRDDIF